ncbi:hypothetical protein F5884DRAFT_734592 [Xylogone sp. PMI_703]|nr:hypothetical protein F5884DRAFT_734592 [Xylogone sp. PMI_703]
MSQRRFHTKSRHGCLQCKKNRTKCDEVKPKCGRCKRIGSDCSLTNQASGFIFTPAKGISAQKEQSGVKSVDSISATSDISSPQSILWLQKPKSATTSTSNSGQPVHRSHFTDAERGRLRLMNHYVLHTSPSITEITTPSDPSIWTDWVPELAFDNDFLLHGLLSLSALHLALRDVSRQKHIALAVHHNDLGVGLFRRYLSNPTNNQYDAAFAFSCAVAFYSFGIQRCTESGMNQITKIHQVLVLLRQSATIFKSKQESLLQSRWSVLALRHELGSTGVPDEVDNMLSKLEQYNTTKTSDIARQNAYATSIKVLRHNLRIAIEFQNRQFTITWFPIMSPAGFWTMLDNGEPLALAILANYAVILYRWRESIWLKGWGKETVDAIRQTLSAEWHDCIAWAIRETEFG